MICRAERLLFKRGRKSGDIFLQQSPGVSLAATCTAFPPTCPCSQQHPLSASEAAVKSVCKTVKISNTEQDVQETYRKNAKHILEQKSPKARFLLSQTPWCKSSEAHCWCYFGWLSATWMKEKCWTDFLAKAAASLIVLKPCQVRQLNFWLFFFKCDPYYYGINS